jgi:hypothetical protein
MNFKYILKIFIVVSVILSSIVFINSIGFNLNAKKLLTMEGLTNPPDTSIIINKSDAFCESHRGSSGTLDKSCGKLTKNNCNSTSCCVWTSNNKCVAGGAGGPTFNTDSNGKTKELGYYYFQNKCHGTKCP